MSADSVRDLLSGMIGGQMPGGCEKCDAYQKLTEQSPGVFLMNVYHDDDCPELRRMRQAR